MPRVIFMDFRAELYLDFAAVDFPITNLFVTVHIVDIWNTMP
jgi:hypothetical protein